MAGHIGRRRYVLRGAGVRGALPGPFVAASRDSCSIAWGVALGLADCHGSAASLAITLTLAICPSGGPLDPRRGISEVSMELLAARLCAGVGAGGVAASSGQARQCWSVVSFVSP